MAKLFRANTTKVSLPKQVDVVIDGISHEGRGISRWKNKPLFVRGGWIGETLRVKVTREQSRFAEAEVIEVLAANPDRILPKCAIAETCGGCQLQHVPEESQIHHKQQWVADQFTRFGANAPIGWLPPLVSRPWHYRHRARLAVWRNRQGKIVLGFREQGTKTIVPVSDCPTLVPELSDLLQALQPLIESGKKPCSVEHLELLWDGQRRAVILRVNNRWQEKHQHLWESHAKRWGESIPTDLWLRTSNCCERFFASDDSFREDSPQSNTLPYRYRLAEWGIDIYFHPNDFTQVNFSLNQAMVSQALRLLQADVGKVDSSPEAVKNWQVLDLFCGVGNFTLPLAKVCGSVVGVEALPHMVERGKVNAERNGINNAEFVAADLTKIETLSAAWLQKNFHAVLLDPPRAGAKEILPFVVKLGVSRVIYVSCNSASLARDAVYMQQQGYRMETAGVMDMFPQTSHVETLSLFVKSES